MAGSNASLNKAYKAKKDEFYTQLADIERELAHYDEHFRGKIVLCNCDDPYESNFFKYFAMNFNRLGLKKLIATCYYSSPVYGTEINLFNESETPIRMTKKKAVQFRIAEIPDMNGDGAIDLEDAELLIQKRRPYRVLKGDQKYPAGDFRSEECIKLLQEADIIVTNPPFSLFREYVAQLVHYKKRFLIIGNQNAIHYKEIFPLIRDNEMWLGYHNGDMAFKVPSSYEPRATRYWQDENGQKWRSMGNICWFTNLDIQKRHEEMELWKTYNEEEYPIYENYDAIEVGRTADIPKDYFGKMGVPDTFLQNYNPQQFEIIGLAESELGISIGVSANLSKEELQELKEENPSFRRGNPIYRDANGVLKKPYSRIIIRRLPA